MIVLCSLNDKAAWRGETFATTMRAIEGLPLIDCLRPSYELVHGWKYWGETWDWYTAEYRKLLQTRWPDVKRWLDGLSPDEDITLVCFCGPKAVAIEGQHCHRYLIAKLIEKWRPDIPLDVH